MPRMQGNRHHREMDPDLVEKILERHGEANNTQPNPSKRDLNDQIIERIEDIFRDPEKAEVELQKLRDEETKVQEEARRIEETKRIQEAYMKYVQMIAAKKLPVALNYFRAHSSDIIEGYVRWGKIEKLSFDLRTFLLLLQNKNLLKQVPSNWIEHTMMGLFFPILQRRPDIINNCPDIIESISKWYPLWKTLIPNQREH